MEKHIEDLSSEEIRNESEKLHSQLDEAKQSVDRLFSGQGSEDDLDKIGKFILNAQKIRDELTEAKMYDFASVLKAQKLYEFLKETFPDAEVKLIKDEIFGRISVEVFRKKGLAFDLESWRKVCELSSGSLNVSAIIDDFDSELGGMCFSFNLMIYKYKG